MKNTLLFILLAFPPLCACGPKEIGQGLSEPPDYSHEATASDLMRYPMTGATNMEKRLYYVNKPDVMVKMQKMNISAWKQKTGVSPEDPAYREVPVQRSPFKQ